MEWKPIETAPKNGKDILIFNDELIRIGFFDEARGEVWSVWPGRAQAFQTHWMPLPEAPNVKVSGCATEEITNGDNNHD